MLNEKSNLFNIHRKTGFRVNIYRSDLITEFQLFRKQYKSKRNELNNDTSKNTEFYPCEEHKKNKSNLVKRDKFFEKSNPVND